MELVSPQLFSGPEALTVTAERGRVVFRAPHLGARLTPERSLALAFALLELHSPECMRAVERAVHSPPRLVGAGDAA